MALLFGLEPPPVASCRVLELGCGSAGNLASIALTLPGATCIGIDNAEQAIGRGLRLVAEAGLPNITLAVKSILDVDEAFGRFDFIICHGVYSWVPREVQDKILEICARNLADNGVAFVSYNAFPGWHLQRMVREMMQYHVRGFKDPAQRAEQARSLLDLLARFSDSSDNYRQIIENEARSIQKLEDWYLLHDNLAAVNTPVYFHEFVERAAEAELQYLGPAVFPRREVRLSPELTGILDRLSDRVRREQYLDFLSGRMFKRSLLCRRGPTIRSEPSAENVPRLFLSATARPDNPHPDTASETVEKFRTTQHDELSTNRPLLKTMLLRLAELAPRTISFDQLWNDVVRRLPPADAARETADELARVLLFCSRANFVDLVREPFEIETTVQERPVVSPLARLQAREGELLTNLKHQIVSANELVRQVLTRCDGAHDRPALQSALAAHVEAEELELHSPEGEKVSNPAKVRDVEAAMLEEILVDLAGQALLAPG